MFTDKYKRLIGIFCDEPFLHFLLIHNAIQQLLAGIFE